MSCIRILSDHLANQIAAGEVVERPASVVKELLENSLDASSTRITVQVEGGGTRLLRVVDDGMGMDGDDVLLCLERHATSKLQEESQLAAITTLGFRGEAIPSIASVSRLTLISRTVDGDIGTRAEVRYGTLHAVHEQGCARGTVVEVKTLFGNIPARKKFLKSARTELFHIEEVVKNLALAHPETAFELQVDGRTRCAYPTADSLEERMRAVFGYQDKVMPLTDAGNNDGLTLDGFLCLPQSVSPSSARLRLLVNGRAVHDRMLRHAVIEGLQGFLMKGHTPAGVIRLSLPASEIDVNVHPAKLEIRFRNPRAVHRFVATVTRTTVQQYQEGMRAELFSVDGDREHGNRTVGLQPSAVPPQALPEFLPVDETVTGMPRSPGHSVAVTNEPVGEERERVGHVSPPALSPTTVSDEEKTCSGLTIIGQLLDLYLLCEREGHLVVIDQHAAHERILYGRLVQAYFNRDIPRQSLLFPVTVELLPGQCELLEKYGPEIGRLGLQADHFGDNTYVIKAVPALVSRLSPEEILLNILAALQTWGGSGQGGLPESVSALFASMACKAAIKAGNSLQPKEMLSLLQQMEESEVFSHCPHGRPVIKTFTRQEIEKWFHRS